MAPSCRSHRLHRSPRLRHEVQPGQLRRSHQLGQWGRLRPEQSLCVRRRALLPPGSWCLRLLLLQRGVIGGCVVADLTLSRMPQSWNRLVVSSMGARTYSPERDTTFVTVTGIGCPSWAC